jgi:hypothetical protein
MVRNYRYLLRNNPEERSSQLLHGGSLKSQTQRIFTCARPRANQTVQNLYKNLWQTPVYWNAQCVIAEPPTAGTQ